MSQYNAPGAGVIFSGDRIIERKVVVSTSGNPQAPGGNGILTNAAITEEAAGIKRGVFEYTIAAGGGGASSGYDSYGKKIELMGGSREISIFNHPNFANLSVEQIQEVQRAVESKIAGPFPNEAMQKLYGFLTRQIEYFLSPSVVARVSEIESSVPNTTGLCKVADPPEVSAPGGTFWVLTGISATPIGGQFEVTREYTSIPSAWDDVEFLYNNW